MTNNFQYFVGVDWGAEKHRICLMDSQGNIRAQRWVIHSGSDIAELIQWLRKQAAADPSQVGVGIETPHGAISETLIEQNFSVFSINPKQLDRFRDRFTAAGAKDDSRDAQVLADSLRTDPQAFQPVYRASPATVRLRELSRLSDTLMQELSRVTNQLWSQLQRFFPQMLELGSGAEEPWLWDLLEKAPTPARAAKLTPAAIRQILARHRIRKLDADKIQAVLRTPPLVLAPGGVEAASEHVQLLLPQLRLLHQQHTRVHHRLQEILQEMADQPSPEPQEHRDVVLLLSLPGVGKKVAATMLSEAPKAIAERDYHALRCLAGCAPVTRQSGKKSVIVMRSACNPRLRYAFYHWGRVLVMHDERAKQAYARLRASGKSHGRALRGVVDRALAVLVAVLRSGTPYDAQRRSA